jgi:hypothetical protein
VGNERVSIALGKPGTWMKSRASWQIRWSCFAVGQPACEWSHGDASDIDGQTERSKRAGANESKLSELASSIFRLWHRHPTYYAPILSAPQPRMCNTQSVRRSTTVLLRPSESYPITREGDISSHVNRSRLKFYCFESQTFTGLRGNPVRNVILANRRGTNRRPTQEVFVP